MFSFNSLQETISKNMYLVTDSSSVMSIAAPQWCLSSLSSAETVKHVTSPLYPTVLYNWCKHLMIAYKLPLYYLIFVLITYSCKVISFPWSVSPCVCVCVYIHLYICVAVVLWEVNGGCFILSLFVRWRWNQF